mgnify:FL=1
MRRAARIDKNQPQIVEALRRTGASVKVVSQLKKFCDIVVVHKGTVYLAEIKDGTKSKSSKRLTPGENEYRLEVEQHGGTYYVIECITDALRMIGEDQYCLAN